MSRRRYKAAQKITGTSPGTVTYVGREVEHATRLARIEYNASDYRIDDSGRLSTCRLPNTEADHITWLDVDGIHQSQVIETIGRQYGLHPLLLEDVVNTEQKPKLEIYDDRILFVTLKMLHCSDQLKEIDSEHISFAMGKNFLVSFQEERTSDIFTPVLDRIKASAGKTRKNGVDYLLYSLMDVVVDRYFEVLDFIGGQLDALEDQIVLEQAEDRPRADSAQRRQTLPGLYNLKRELTYVRRVVWPLRDMIGQLIREENPLVQPATLPYLRDLYDHITQVIETIDAYRELIPGLMDVYLSSASNRMNAVMKTLTIFSAIFMPLTFIVGVYGMNFDHMPELRNPNGYYYTWGAMATITVGLIIYFRRRGWF
jgi:magnesium transporter